MIRDWLDCLRKGHLWAIRGLSGDHWEICLRCRKTRRF